MDSAQLHDVVADALKAGADAAEAVFSERRSLDVGVREGRLEEVEREEAADLSLRVFVEGRPAVVSGSDRSAAAVTRMIERAVAMARLAPADPYAGLADEALLSRAPPTDLDLLDSAEPAAEALQDQALAAEAAARAVEGVAKSDGASAGWSQGAWRLVTSAGFDGAHAASRYSLSASAIAGEGAAMERGGEGRSVRRLQDMPSPEEIGTEGGRRAAARVGPRKLSSTTAPVIFENRVAASLLGPLVGAIAGPSIARGTSFLKDKLGQPVFAPAVTVMDDPHRPRGLGSTPFDDEGVRNGPRALVQDGVLTTWLLNTAAARQLGLTSTGHASRGGAGAPGVSTTNLYMEPGEADLAELMRQAGAGLLVASMFGPSLNGNTGDWSTGVQGFWFEGGEIAYPVSEITVAGNLLDLWARCVPGSDLEFRGGTNAPSLLFDAVAIAGK